MNKRKRLWIIGGSSGIGFELVKILLDNDYRLIVSSRNASNNESLLKLQSQFKNSLYLINLDANQESFKEEIEQAWSIYDAYCKGTDFIQKYIFPGGHLPSVSSIIHTTSNHTDLHLLHMEEFTEHYAKTLNIWHKNFQEKLEEIQNLRFDEYFIRMWKMYLGYCEAAFLTRNVHLVQLAFSRYNNTALNEGLVALKLNLYY